MTKVGVVGGGTAGLQAAAAASRMGSEVTIVEKEEVPDLPWRDLPDLIQPCGEAGPLVPYHFPDSANILTAEARSFRAGLVVTSGGEVRCCCLVLATGSTSEPPPFRGWRKPGVFVLDSQRSYHDLGRESGALGRVVVAGEGRRALEVADRLTGGGRSIRIAVSQWQGGSPSPPVLDAISRAAEERNVSITPGRLTGAVGAGRVEAAVADGEVIPCDTIVFVPRRLPRVPGLQARLGRTGAVLVGRRLMADIEGVFAAGGCAEVEGAEPPSTLAGEPGSSGRIAGANCLGGGLSLGSSWSTESLLFGLRWVRMTSRQPGSRRDLTAVRRTGEGTACEVAFDRRSGRVARVEFVKAIASGVMGEIPSTLDLNLKELAYGSGGSSDISLVSETARLGLR